MTGTPWGPIRGRQRKQKARRIVTGYKMKRGRSWQNCFSDTCFMPGGPSRGPERLSRGMPWGLTGV